MLEQGVEVEVEADIEVHGCTHEHLKLWEHKLSYDAYRYTRNWAKSCTFEPK
jgi:hypothetical protein